MKIQIEVSKHNLPIIKKLVDEFNDWPYKKSLIGLSACVLSLDLSDFPVFWCQFLAQSPSLCKQLKQSVLQSFRKIPEDRIDIEFKKAMEALES